MLCYRLTIIAVLRAIVKIAYIPHSKLFGVAMAPTDCRLHQLLTCGNQYGLRKAAPESLMLDYLARDRIPREEKRMNGGEQGREW